MRALLPAGHGPVAKKGVRKMSTEEKKNCPDCVPIPERESSTILRIVALAFNICVVFLCILVAFYKADANLFEIITSQIIGCFNVCGTSFFLFSFYRSIVGRYTDSYLDPENQRIVHTHKSIIQADDKFFHLKKTKTEESYTEQRVEIIGPIFKLKCGGWFKRSEIFNQNPNIMGRYIIVSSDNSSVLLGDSIFANVQLRKPLKNALEVVRDLNSIDDLIYKAELCREALAAAKAVREKHDETIGERDFLGVCMVETCRALLESKSKNKSPVGQATRERLERMLTTITKNHPEYVEAWYVHEPTVSNPTYDDLIKRFESIDSPAVGNKNLCSLPAAQ
ncbi:MAG: hypothetical protein AAB575_04370 [Patescibacteria group bacterium]